MRWWLMWLLCLTPLLIIIGRVAQVMHDPYVLGPDPSEVILHWLGHITMFSLIAILTVRPLTQLMPSVRWLMQYRRMIGLTVFLYAFMHGLFYVVVTQGLSWQLIQADIIKRWYISLGFVALLLLMLLAITSHYGLRRRLGNHRWQALHNAVYVIALLSILHYALQVRSDWSQLGIYGTAIVGLLFMRLLLRLQMIKLFRKIKIK